MRGIFCLLLCLSFFPALADEGDRMVDARQSGVAELRVLYVESPGWAWRDDDGRLTGVTVEIMRWFAEDLRDWYGFEVNLEFVEETDWTRFYNRVRDASGGVFGLGNVTITEERAEELAFSSPYVSNVAVLISSEGMPRATGPEVVADKFDGLRGLAFAGTLHETRLERLRENHWPALEIDSAESNDEIIENVAAGTHFGWIDGYNFYRARSEGHPLRRHSAFDDTGEEFGIIMPLDNDWRDAMDDFFTRDGGLIHSDRYRQLLVEHLGKAVATLLTSEK